jgi:SAM-dependent methyltransferase
MALESPQVVRCGWCEATIREGGERLGHRVRCAACGAWTIEPAPTEGDLERAYAGWYRPAGGRFAGFGDALLGRLRARLAARLDRRAPAGRVLDVGAGEGALLDALRSRGRDVLGIDRAASHPSVREMELAEVEGEWAAIVFWHSLEHLPRAGAGLDRAASILVPGGVLAIAMPNSSSFQARVFGERWFAVDFPRHLVHVPSSALLGRLRRLGMKAERVSYWRGGQVAFGWLHGFVGWLPGRPNLYDAIRRQAAREDPMPALARMLALAAAVLLLPAALLCAAVEIACRQGGTVYVEARLV